MQPVSTLLNAALSFVNLQPLHVTMVSAALCACCAGASRLHHIVVAMCLKQVFPFSCTTSNLF